jgi:outer membrane protein assembly factor BamE (lipoprotein component of BamABCDE complex)
MFHGAGVSAPRQRPTAGANVPGMWTGPLMSRARYLAVLLLLALHACTSVTAFRTHREADFEPLRPGMSAVEVEHLIGSPAIRTTLPRLGEEVWDYRYFDAQTPMLMQLHFDLGGALKYQARVQDHDYIHGGTER